MVSDYTTCIAKIRAYSVLIYVVNYRYRKNSGKETTENAPMRCLSGITIANGNNGCSDGRRREVFRLRGVARC